MFKTRKFWVTLFFQVMVLLLLIWSVTVNRPAWTSWIWSADPTLTEAAAEVQATVLIVGAAILQGLRFVYDQIIKLEDRLGE